MTEFDKPMSLQQVVDLLAERAAKTVAYGDLGAGHAAFRYETPTGRADGRFYVTNAAYLLEDGSVLPMGSAIRVDESGVPPTALEAFLPGKVRFFVPLDSSGNEIGTAPLYKAGEFAETVESAPDGTPTGFKHPEHVHNAFFYRTALYQEAAKEVLLEALEQGRPFGDGAVLIAQAVDDLKSDAEVAADDPKLREQFAVTLGSVVGSKEGRKAFEGLPEEARAKFAAEWAEFAASVLLGDGTVREPKDASNLAEMLARPIVPLGTDKKPYYNKELKDAAERAVLARSAVNAEKAKAEGRKPEGTVVGRDGTQVTYGADGKASRVFNPLLGIDRLIGAGVSLIFKMVGKIFSAALNVIDRVRGPKL